MRNKICLIVLLLILASLGEVVAQSSSFPEENQNNSGMKKFRNVTPIGYSQYVEIDLGNSKMIVVSGQVSVDEEGKTIGVGNFEKQTEQIFYKLKTIAESSGGSVSDIVKLNYYLTDIANIQTLRDVRDRFVNTHNPPASAAVQVSKLFRDDILIEIEATLIISKKETKSH